MTLKLSDAAKKAFKLGSLCSVSYLAVYIVRNNLSALSPQMLKDGFTTENLGSLSSAFFITYAIGQLINGIIGDKIKAKYMISLGLILSGLCNYIFAAFSDTFSVMYISYSLMGFFLSMIYGPMTKVVSDSVDLLYATRCSIGYNFASLLGSPLSGVLAAILAWRIATIASGTILIIMGIVCICLFSYFERKGIVKHNKYSKTKEKGSSIKLLIKRDIIRFTVISVLTGIIRTTVVFWLPTYISQYLGFNEKTSALLFTVVTLFISTAAFVSIFVYEKLGYNMYLTVFLSFLFSASGFLGVYLFKLPVLNIIFMILALFAANCAASMLWSRYCPSLSDTGMVSSATGYLDFMSYMSASISSTIFANAVNDIGWKNLILVWFALMAVGVSITLPIKKRN